MPSTLPALSPTCAGRSEWNDCRSVWPPREPPRSTCRSRRLWLRRPHGWKCQLPASRSAFHFRGGQPCRHQDCVARVPRESATHGLAVVKQHHIDAPCIDQCRGVVESDNAADHFDPMAGKNLRQQLAQKTLIVVHKQYSNAATSRNRQRRHRWRFRSWSSSTCAGCVA